MNQTLKTVLVAVICLLLGAGAFYAWSSMNELREENEQLSEQLSDTTAAAPSVGSVSPEISDETPAAVIEQNGSISGTLGYPSQGIPPLAVYAYKTGNYASYTALLTEQNQMSFTIEDLEPGSYVLVAYTLETPGLSGGYTKAVPCGLSVECTDHSLIPVTVTAGKATTGVEIKDWYAPEGTFPAKP